MCCSMWTLGNRRLLVLLIYTPPSSTATFSRISRTNRCTLLILMLLWAGYIIIIVVVCSSCCPPADSREGHLRKRTTTIHDTCHIVGNMLGIYRWTAMFRYWLWFGAGWWWSKETKVWSAFMWLWRGWRFYVYACTVVADCAITDNGCVGSCWCTYCWFGGCTFTTSSGHNVYEGEEVVVNDIFFLNKKIACTLGLSNCYGLRILHRGLSSIVSATIQQQ